MGLGKWIEFLNTKVGDRMLTSKTEILHQHSTFNFSIVSLTFLDSISEYFTAVSFTLLEKRIFETAPALGHAG